MKALQMLSCTGSLTLNRGSCCFLLPPTVAFLPPATTSSTITPPPLPSPPGIYPFAAPISYILKQAYSLQYQSCQGAAAYEVDEVYPSFSCHYYKSTGAYLEDTCSTLSCFFASGAVGCRRPHDHNTEPCIPIMLSNPMYPFETNLFGSRA